jgi:hypothetical protein
VIGVVGHIYSFVEIYTYHPFTPIIHVLVFSTFALLSLSLFHFATSFNRSIGFFATIRQNPKGGYFLVAPYDLFSSQLVVFFFFVLSL